MRSNDWLTPSVKAWLEKLALEAPSTATIYRSTLGRYWLTLQSQYDSIDGWVRQVEQEQQSSDITVRRAWATQLESFVNSYVSPSRGRPLVKSSKNVIVSAVTSFLKRCLGDKLESYDFSLGTKAERLQEIKRVEDTPAVEPEEIKRLYGECKNRRDRAILSTLLSGFGVSEWHQFSKDWFRYINDIENSKVPVKVSVTRPKTSISYTPFLWDDAVEDLRELLHERQRDVGRQLTKDDPLFANQSEGWIRTQDVQRLIRRIADRSGVEKRDRSKVSYRIRPHELGRDYFRTQCSLLGVQHDAAEYLLGHSIDPLLYNKMHKTKQGQDMIAKEASKLRSVLNIRTGKSAPFSALEDPRVITLQTLAKALYPADYEQIEISVKDMAGRGASVEDALKFLSEEIAKRKKSSETVEYEYARIPEDKSDNHLSHGFEFITMLPSGLMLVRKPKAR